MGGLRLKVGRMPGLVGGVRTGSNCLPQPPGLPPPALQGVWLGRSAPSPPPPGHLQGHTRL